MKLAIAGETLGSIKGLSEILDIFATVGVSAIELWPENIPPLAGKELRHYRLYQNRDCDAAAEILARKGFVVPCIAFGAAFDINLANDIKLFASQLCLGVETAHRLGAKLVNLYCYHICMDLDFNLERLNHYFGPAIEVAEKLGLIITLENEAHDTTRSPDNMLAIIDAFNSPCFRTNFDATNYYQAGFEPFPGAYETLKSVIAYVHIKNGCIFQPTFGHDVRSKGEHMTGIYAGHDIYYPTASDGVVNVEGLLRRLKNDGFDGWCTLEPHTAPELCLGYYKDETTYLRELGYF